MAIETNKPSFGVLDDVKVVYAAVELAVPKACDLMADWGADVTWLENTGAGDTIRDTDFPRELRHRPYHARGGWARNLGIGAVHLHGARDCRETPRRDELAARMR